MNQEQDKSPCPDASQMLAFCEGTLWGGKRRKLERHFSKCAGCRQALALLLKAEREEPEEIEPVAVEHQAALVMAMLAKEERGSRDSGVGTVRLSSRRRLVWAGAVAILALAVGAPVAYKLYFSGSPFSQVRVALARAVVGPGGRRTEARVSGLPYAKRLATRGEGADDSMAYNRAENLLNEIAGDSHEKTELLAQIRLARSRGDDVEKALAALLGLEKSEGLSAELANNIGAALFEQRENERALRYFNLALSRRPGYPEALFNRALAEEGLGQTRNAEEDWSAYIGQAPPNDQWISEAESHLHSLNPEAPSISGTPNR